MAANANVSMACLQSRYRAKRDLNFQHVQMAKHLSDTHALLFKEFKEQQVG